MNTALEATKTTTRRGAGRGRALMKLAGGAAALGVLATAACAPAERSTATPSPTQPATSLAAGDTSNGADNFYSSDRVTVQKVTFKNQYQMNVTGNLFVPNDMDRNTKNPAMIVGHPMGAVKERAPTSTPPSWPSGASSPCPSICPTGARVRGNRATWWHPMSTPKTSAQPSIPAHPVLRRHRTHRCARRLWQRKFRHQRRQDRPPDQGRGHGQHVRHGWCQPQWTARRDDPRAATAGPCPGRAAARRRIRRRRK